MNDFILVIVWALFGGFSSAVISEVRHEEEIKNLKIKCVEMREMPLGACSRLFGEGE